MPKMTGKRSFLFLLTIGFLCSLVYASVAQAAEILREAVPLERNHVALHLERYIEQDGQSKKPILFVHGVTFSSHEFDVNYKDYSLARYFAKHGYEVWLLDIAGFGHSEAVKDGFMPDSDYAAEDINAAVRKIVEITGQNRIDVLGWSWGTVTVSRFASRHGEHVGKIILYAPILSGVGQYDVKDPFHHNTWEHATDDFQKTKDGSFDLNITDPVVIEMLASGSWHYDRESSPNGGRRDICVPEDKRLIDFSGIEAPVLVIYGGKDPYLNYELLGRISGELPAGSEMQMIDGASHVAYIEKPYYRKFQRMLIEFLRK